MRRLALPCLAASVAAALWVLTPLGIFNQRPFHHNFEATIWAASIDQLINHIDEVVTRGIPIGADTGIQALLGITKTRLSFADRGINPVVS